MLQNLRYNEEEINFDESMKNMNCNEEEGGNLVSKSTLSTLSRKIEGSSRSRMDKQKMKTSYKFCKSLQSRQIQRQQQITDGKGVFDKYFDQILQILQNYTKSTNSKAALDHGWRGCFCVLPCITNIDHQAPRDLINLSQPKSR